MGKGEVLEECTDGIMQILQFASSVLSFCTTPVPRTLNFLGQHALHVLFIFPAPVPDGVLDGTVAPNA